MSKGEILEELIKVRSGKDGKLRIQDKGWITRHLKEEREHEFKMSLLKWLAEDPEAKYYVGVVGGAGVGVVGAMLANAGYVMGDDWHWAERTIPCTPGEEVKAWLGNERPDFLPGHISPNKICGSDGFMTQWYKKAGPKPEEAKKAGIKFDWDWLIPTSGLPEMVVESVTGDIKLVEWDVTDGKDGMFNNIGHLLSLSGFTFSSFCAAILLLKAFFGDEGFKGLNLL